MKRLITILVSAIAAVALLVGGTVYAAKPQPPPPTPTPNVIMESGSGTLPLYSGNDSDNSTMFPPKVTFTTDTNDAAVVTGGYGEVAHVSLTLYLADEGGQGELSNGYGYVNVQTLSSDSVNPYGLTSFVIFGKDFASLSSGETIEFDAYQAWSITIGLTQDAPSPNSPPYVIYNYTVTYPSQ